MLRKYVIFLIIKVLLICRLAFAGILAEYDQEVANMQKTAITRLQDTLTPKQQPQLQNKLFKNSDNFNSGPQPGYSVKPGLLETKPQPTRVQAPTMQTHKPPDIFTLNIITEPPKVTQRI